MTVDISQRGFKQRVNIAILCILYIVFLFTTALWALEVAQLMGLDGILLYPNDLSTDAKFKSFYALIARETKITGVLFECQVSANFTHKMCSGSNVHSHASDDRR